jgi:hypothetical protein
MPPRPRSTARPVEPNSKSNRSSWLLVIHTGCDARSIPTGIQAPVASTTASVSDSRSARLPPYTVTYVTGPGFRPFKTKIIGRPSRSLRAEILPPYLARATDASDFGGVSNLDTPWYCGSTIAQKSAAVLMHHLQSIFSIDGSPAMVCRGLYVIVQERTSLGNSRCRMIVVQA